MNTDITALAKPEYPVIDRNPPFTKTVANFNTLDYLRLTTISGISVTVGYLSGIKPGIRGPSMVIGGLIGVICGKTMLDMISNGVFRTVIEVETIISKMREGRLRWFGHVRRRPQQALVRRVEALIVNGKRRRGRPKLKWEDRLKLDMKELLLFEDMTSIGMREEIGLAFAGRLD
ncbi:polyprotein [Tanacetum coccineum]